jgi:hypothetical protein
LIAAVYVVVPVMLFVWTRIRHQEARQPALVLRRARRLPLQVFILLQCLAAIGFAIMFGSALVGTIITGLSGVILFLGTGIPFLLASAVHALAALLALGSRPRWERGFIVFGGTGLFIVSFVLMVLLAVNHATAESPLLEPHTQPERSTDMDPADLPLNENRSFYN